MKKIINCFTYFIILQSTLAFAGDVVITSNPSAAGGYQVKTDYLFFTLNNLGTLGNDYSSPGIQHDPLGGRSFSAGKDYITPGAPFEGFSVDYNSSTLHNNNEDWSSSSPITGSYTNRSTSSLLDLTWQGTKAGFFDISHKFSLSSTGQNLNITTTITALSDLTGVKFLRVVDPDQDSSSDLGGSSTSSTNNTRGLGSYPATDIVCASGAVRADLKVCLYSNSSETHNTAVSPGWSTIPSVYLAGSANHLGDDVIGIAANLGSLSTGTTKTFTYSYLFSSSADMLAEIIALASAPSGPSVADTQSSLSTLARRLRTPYNYALMSSNYANMNTYDCNIFDKNNMCFSVGGRVTIIDNPSSNHSAAVLVLGHKISPHIRIGGFLDQSVSNHMSAGVDMSNKHPMAGAFAVWNHQADGLGFQVKMANAYLNKDVTTTREITGTSEAGRGHTDLNTQSYVGELSYAFQYKEQTLVRPYFALRYTRIKQDGYTEEASSSVTSPLTYAKLSDRSTTALMGVKLNHTLTPKTNLTASLGIEQDIENKSDKLTASGISGLTSENFYNNFQHTRPVASFGAYYAIAKNQRLSGDIYYQQLPYQSTDSASAYVNYMIGF